MEQCFFPSLAELSRHLVLGVKKKFKIKPNIDSFIDCFKMQPECSAETKSMFFNELKGS